MTRPRACWPQPRAEEERGAHVHPELAAEPPEWLLHGLGSLPLAKSLWEQVRALPSAFQRRLAAVAERLARVSPRLAAGAVQRGLGDERRGPDDVPVRLVLLEAATQEPPLPREAFELLLTLPKRSFAESEAFALVELLEQSRRLLPWSRRLSAAYLRAGLLLCARVPIEHLRQAAEVAREVAEQGGPVGEFVSLAFVEALPSALPKLDAAGLALWARCGVRFHQTDWGRDWFRRPPAALWRLRVSERSALLRAVWECREKERTAARLYHDLPQALLPLRPVEREQLLELCLRSVTQEPAAWESLATTCGALLRSFRAPLRSRALRLLERVSDEFARAVPVLLPQLPRLAEQFPLERIESWADYGLHLAARNPAAALAFFACESRTSARILHASPTAAELQEVRGWLAKYLHMLAGSPFSVRCTSTVSLRPRFEDQPLEGEVELPERIDWFPTFEDNVRLYQWLAVQLAGRWEHGTYAGAENGELDWQRALAQSEPRMQLAEWFSLAEGYRVACASARSYPAWAAEQEALARALLRLWHERGENVRVSWFDRLLAWLLSGEPPAAAPAGLGDVVKVVARALEPLRHPGASADTALALAQVLAQSFAPQVQSAVVVEESAGETPPYLLVADLLEGEEMPPLPGGSTGEADAAAPAETAGADKQWSVDDAVPDAAGQPLSPEALQALLERGADLHLQQGKADAVASLGFYISDLLGKLPLEQRERLRRLLAQEQPTQSPRRFLDRRVRGAEFFYDEWDYLIQDYRRQWCRLVELPVEGDSGEFFIRTIEEYAGLLPQVRREFQKVRADQYRFVRGLESGEEIDLNAVVEARSDLRARRTPSSKLYRARQREERDVATLFLVDLSASTDEPAEPSASLAQKRPPRRIIDIAKEALVLMAAALEEIGDAYAIYGFSGHGRQNVEFYLVKSFRESLSSAVKGRIGALEPKRSTRMGAAVRHAVEKMAAVSARSRHLILLSDGFPQDFDYGQDRRSNTYGLRDTTMALKECEAAGIVPFCVTVDRAGHDYLREMCPSSRYLVIDDIPSLPRELPKIYQRVVGR